MMEKELRQALVDLVSEENFTDSLVDLVNYWSCGFKDDIKLYQEYRDKVLDSIYRDLFFGRGYTVC